MRTRHLFWTAVCLAIGMSGCTAYPPPQSPHPRCVDTAKACADWRWIGISRPGAQCPDIPGWTVRPLFCLGDLQSSEDCCSPKPSEQGAYGGEGESERVPGPEVIRELSRFCVYEAAHEWLLHPILPPPKSADLVRLDQDCAGLSTAGTTDLDAKTAEGLFLAQAGVPARPFRIAHPYSVRLAFLDTQPTYGDVPQERGNSPHGYALANIGRHLVCSQGSCAARITTRLALPIIEFNPKSPQLTRRDERRGGYLGMQSDLAEAIQSEVDAWRRDRRGGSERHLVLNLSLAWDGELFGGLAEAQVAEMQAGTQAVYRALQYAAGFDALVLAAVGNRKGEPCNDFGPLLPAAWEVGGPREPNSRAPGKAPLLYAVGGMGADGFPVVNARPGGMPRRAAYAENAVVTTVDLTRYTPSLTGSSVGTAVVSSIVAVVWSSFPELGSKKVMEIVDASGDELLMPADLWSGASVSPLSVPPKVHQLSLCLALEQACRQLGSASCPVQLPCGPSLRESFALPEPSGRGTWVVWDSCQPWAYPQPQSPPCLSCGPP